MEIERIIKYFEKYETDHSIQSYIAQANSRFILYNADEKIENFPNYTPELDNKCLHIAFSYLNFGWYLYRQDKERAIYCIEKAAEVLEHLYAYKSCEKTYKEFYNITCGLAYYISSQYSKSFIVLQYYTNESEMAKLLKCFLVRDFLELDETIMNIMFAENSDTENMEEFIYLKILAKALIRIMHYAVNGDTESINESKDILLDLISLTEINEESYLWWIFKLLYLVFDEYEGSSLWNIIPPIISDEHKCRKYIHANLYKQPSVIELFKSQRECLEKSICIGGSSAIGMPTSSGKTKIAEILILKTLCDNPDGICIYIAPFRSLANEVEHGLASILYPMGYTISHLYGSVQATQIDREQITEANVVIATPEKIKSILRSSPEIEERIKLVIIDEGHLVGAKRRYITSELLIEEIKITLKKNNGKCLLLSAVLPNLTEFAEWISGNDKSVSKSFWRPSAQRFGELDFVNNTVNLKWEGNPETFNNRFIEPKLIKKAYVTKTGRKYNVKYFPNDKKEAVGATAVKMLSMGSVLIYVGRSNMVLSQARVISEIFKEKEITHQWRNLDSLKYVELACEEAYGKDSEIYTLLLKGIVCHSSKLPNDVRQGIKELISNDSPKIIIATSTLGQGVNIGVSTVIISNVYLDQENLVEVKDFWNISGRAGRAFTDSEGKILFAIDRTKNDYSINIQKKLKEIYFSKHNIEKAESGILILLIKLLEISKECGIEYTLFLELLSENREAISTDTAKVFFDKCDNYLDLIDDTLISMNLKNGATHIQDCTKWIEEAFRGSLAYIQAKDSRKITQEEVIEIVTARNEGVMKLSGSPHKWKAIACSSVPLRASLFIDEHIEEICAVITKYLNSEMLFADLMQIIEYFDMFILEIPMGVEDNVKQLIELAIRYSIREKWHSGMTVCEDDELGDKVIDICNKYYGFHFPWIINAISKKLLIQGRTEEASILENISLLSEIGVPSIKSAKIYLLGIKSRECAIELAQLIDVDDMPSIKEGLYDVFEMINNDQLRCSEKSYNWLALIKKDSGYTGYKTIPQLTSHLRENAAIDYNELYIKKYKSKFYLCSYDYKIKLRIKDEYENKYTSLIHIPGLYLKRKSLSLWELETNNPYIRIEN